MNYLKSIILLLFVVAILIFSFQNMDLVDLRFLKWNLRIPLSLASIFLYLLGAFSGGIVLALLKKLLKETPKTEKETLQK